MVHPDFQLHFVHKMDQFNQLFTPPQSLAHDSDIIAAILRDIRTMDHELEVERRHIRAKLFMNQATKGQSQGNSPPQSPPLQPVHNNKHQNK